MNTHTPYNDNNFVRIPLIELMNKYDVTIEAISNITKLEKKWLQEFINEKSSLAELNGSERTELIQTIFFLKDSIDSISNDDRLKGTIESLIEFGISKKTIANYSKLETKDIELFLTDSTQLSFENKYKLGIISLFLLGFFRK